MDAKNNTIVVPYFEVYLGSGDTGAAILFDQEHAALLDEQTISSFSEEHVLFKWEDGVDENGNPMSSLYFYFFLDENIKKAHELGLLNEFIRPEKSTRCLQFPFYNIEEMKQMFSTIQSKTSFIYLGMLGDAGAMPLQARAVISLPF